VAPSAPQRAAQLDQEQRTGPAAAASPQMRQHPKTLAERRLTVDDALDGTTHAAMTDEPHARGTR